MNWATKSDAILCVARVIGLVLVFVATSKKSDAVIAVCFGQVPPSKLVLAFPWYAYNYQCAETGEPPRPGSDDTDWCHVVNASILNFFGGLEVVNRKGILASAIGGTRWSNSTGTPYLYYRAAVGAWDSGTVHRLDYDNPASLRLKAAYAKKVGARGVGMWTADLIDYKDDNLVTAFWEAFKPFTDP